MLRVSGLDLGVVVVAGRFAVVVFFVVAGWAGCALPDGACCASRADNEMNAVVTAIVNMVSGFDIGPSLHELAASSLRNPKDIPNN